MLPLTPPWLTKIQSGHVFHIIHDDTSQAVGNSKNLNWYQWRCIESILRHHPTAKLFVYSNTIEQSSFDVLTEVGYQVILRNYEISELIKQTPLMEFFDHLERKSSAEITLEKTMHEHGVLRLLLLYKYGGIYLAENTIVLKNIDISQSNVLSLDSEFYVNPWMLNFEKNHKFLRDALEMFPTMYNAKVKADKGKALLTKVCAIRYSEILCSIQEQIGFKSFLGSFLLQSCTASMQPMYDYSKLFTLILQLFEAFVIEKSCVQ